MTYQSPYPTLPPDPAPLPPPNYYAMRAESLWTDDSGAFYVRVDRLGTITWADKDGNASSEPGTGARPVGSSLALPTGAATDANLTAIAGAAGNSPPALAASASGLLGWLRKIVDTLTGTQPRSIASNAPRVSATGTLGALNAVLTLAVDGMETAGIQLTGTWVGTVSWYGSIDGGNTYFAINATPFGAGLSGASVGSTTGNGQWEIPIPPLTHIQVRMPIYTSGSANAVIAAANGGKIVRVKAPSADALPVSTPIPAAAVAGQVKIAVTGTAVQLPSAALQNGIVIKASPYNAAQTSSYTGAVGGSSAVTTAFDASANTGFPLAPGEGASFAVSNANALWVNGTAGDVFSYEGN